MKILTHLMITATFFCLQADSFASDGDRENCVYFDESGVGRTFQARKGTFFYRSRDGKIHQFESEQEWTEKFSEFLQTKKPDYIEYFKKLVLDNPQPLLTRPLPILASILGTGILCLPLRGLVRGVGVFVIFPAVTSTILFYAYMERHFGIFYTKKEFLLDKIRKDIAESPYCTKGGNLPVETGQKLIDELLYSILKK